ncbi:hypothetical protein [Desulfosporosinus sp. Sb-LF]|uniref:hypothetical protein n=1 Tax=Desulfosporosinus sp. Sb-LF TaxID=2560027 RepID=UPI001101A750|nr:hypothetical protein [Desulfosporosinus sp. Sb-LF]TGE33934.1 hypothetical protein E4K68_03755 [Desulfosporosinus sp. Sb-LF]
MYSLDAKTQNFQVVLRVRRPLPSLAVFLYALSFALIDAIPLTCLSKLRNFLWTWVDGGLERR